MKKKGTLYFFCGKMGAGKSTASQKIAAEKAAVLLSEDDWLSSLYPEQISTFTDYLKYSLRIKPLLKTHVQNILSTGANVVMDFPANTQKQRQWFFDLASEIGADHELIFINVSDAQCLAQIAKRAQEQTERAAFDTEAVFKQVTQYFEHPNASEGLKLTEYKTKAI